MEKSTDYENDEKHLSYSKSNNKDWFVSAKVSRKYRKFNEVQ